MYPTMKDLEEIKAPIQLYVEGSDKGSDIMRPAFTENATMQGVPIQLLFDAIDAEIAEFGEGNMDARIDILDVAGDVACARVVEENSFGKNYVDFLLLVKGEDGWKIVSKVFTEYEL